MGLNPSFVVFGHAIILLMPWVDKQRSGTPEIDFVFSDGSDFLFSNGLDFVFREATLAGSWSDKSKV